MKVFLFAYVVYFGGFYFGPETTHQTFPPMEFESIEACQQYTNVWAKELRFHIEAKQYNIKNFSLHCTTKTVSTGN